MSDLTIREVRRGHLTALWGRRVILGILVIVGIAAPFLFPRDILGVLTLCAAYSVAAIGLTILVGTAGQLSMAHGFFFAIGAYGYTVLASQPREGFIAFGWPPLLAAVGGVLLAAIAGLIFSPVAGRLKGLSLGMASFALVFIADYVLTQAKPLSGGTDGRAVQQLTIGGVPLSGSTPRLVLLGVDMGGMQRFWYVAVIVLVCAAIIALRILRGRPGKALQLLRDNPAAASAMGVNLTRARAGVFVMSSAFAGTGGVLLALASQTVVPQSFDLQLSIDFLVMVVLGGLGSVIGAIVGATLMTLLPTLFDKLGASGVLPFVDASGISGIPGGLFSTLLFGAAVIVILIFAPGGLAGIVRRLTERLTSPTLPNEEPGKSPAITEKVKEYH